MKTLYEQIKCALQEDIDNNQLLSLTGKIKTSLDSIGNYIGLNFGVTDYKAIRVKASCEDLATSLSMIVEKLIELENRIEELENRDI